MNDLLRGRINKLSLDALINLATRAGLAVRVEAYVPPRSRRSSAFDQPDDRQQDDGADRGVDDRGNHAAADHDADPR